MSTQLHQYILYSIIINVKKHNIKVVGIILQYIDMGYEIFKSQNAVYFFRSPKLKYTP